MDTVSKVIAEKQVRTILCVVASAKMNKSRTAYVERLVKESRFGKYMRRTSKLMFHDEENVTKEGDQVLVRQTRPMSCLKRFALVEVVRKALD